MIETATHILRSVFGKTPQQRIAKAPDASITDNPTTTASVKFTPLTRPLKRDLFRKKNPGRPGFCSSTKFADVSKPEKAAKCINNDAVSACEFHPWKTFTFQTKEILRIGPDTPSMAEEKPKKIEFQKGGCLIPANCPQVELNQKATQQ